MLAAMILNPDRQFGTNELIAVGGPGVGAGRNVINAFEKSGVVVRSTRGNPGGARSRMPCSGSS